MKKVKENGRGGNGGRRGEARTEEKDDAAALSRGYRISVYKLGHRRVGSLIRHAGGGRRREEEHGGEGEEEAEIDRTIRG